MSWRGMNRETGRSIDDIEHIRQSIADILTTPVGTRVMRREYGSQLFDLIDQPQNPANNLRLMAATVMAIMRWEPRVQVREIQISHSGTGVSVLLHGSYSGLRINERSRDFSGEFNL